MAHRPHLHEYIIEEFIKTPILEILYTLVLLQFDQQQEWLD